MYFLVKKRLNSTKTDLNLLESRYFLELFRPIPVCIFLVPQELLVYRVVLDFPHLPVLPKLKYIYKNFVFIYKKKLFERLTSNPSGPGFPAYPGAPFSPFSPAGPGGPSAPCLPLGPSSPCSPFVPLIPKNPVRPCVKKFRVQSWRYSNSKTIFSRYSCSFRFQ